MDNVELQTRFHTGIDYSFNENNDGKSSDLYYNFEISAIGVWDILGVVIK